MNQVDSTRFDWVAARASCTPTTVLKALREQAKLDVERRNQLRIPQEVQYEIEFVFFLGGNDSFHVRLSRWSEQLGIASFEKTDKGVLVTYKVKDQELSAISASLTLGNDGECRLRVDNEEYTFWQFRKLALEPIFFNLLGELQQ